jgi:hypothetical protein
VCQIFKFLATKPSTINQLSLSENALKLTYGNVEFQNFPGEDPGPPASREGKGRREEWKKKRGGEGRGRGWGSRKGRGGREGLKEREGKRREGERNLDPRCSRQIDATGLSVCVSLTFVSFVEFLYLSPYFSGTWNQVCVLVFAACI